MGTEIQQRSMPVHKTYAEAQAAFAAAATQVAHGLREHNQGLAAVQLDEVAKHVARNPYLGGLNRENASRVIAMATRLPALSSSQSLADLKGAVDMLEKTPRQATRNSEIPLVARSGAGGLER